jgi:DNA-binding transcriptional ArsR family regulator
MTEFTTSVELEDIAVRDPVISSAVDEPSRAMVLDMLAETEMTINEIDDELADRGYERTENTVRHHVNELRDAGLIEVARLEERRGGTTKYYRANTIVLSYEILENALEDLEPLVSAAEPQIAELVSELRTEYGDVIDRIAGEMAPCQHCRNQKYETYLLLAVLRRAFVQAETSPATE